MDEPDRLEKAVVLMWIFIGTICVSWMVALLWGFIQIVLWISSK